ncbi:MAG: prepilin-type N-terminal cleavage/methylation domain-containing protein, partial [Peptococcaceae bacterium]|nr:prepilin-type N-terminal cleavage/methylation domain-containing protein [Peptococcaceae bacterium]
MGKLQGFRQCIYNCITKKLHSKRGMTLVELLSALIILSLVTGGMAAAVSLGSQQYQKSMRDAEAMVLYSTLWNNLTGILVHEYGFFFILSIVASLPAGQWLEKKLHVPS